MIAPASPFPIAGILASAGGDLEKATEDPTRVLAGLALGAVVLAGIGCLLAVLRIVFPGPTARADQAVGRLGSGRLLLTGILPAIGVFLVGAGAAALGPIGEAAYLLLVALPAGGLVLLGASALVPHLGAGMLGGGEGRGLLLRSVIGAIVLGLAFGAAALVGREGGASIFGLLILGWFFAAGLGATGLGRARRGTGRRPPPTD